LHQLVEESPYRERIVAQLMVALYRSGRQTEALEVYERTRRSLDDDLGLQPSEELQRLAGQIVRQEPRLRTPARLVEVPDGQKTSISCSGRWDSRGRRSSTSCRSIRTLASSSSTTAVWAGSYMARPTRLR